MKRLAVLGAGDLGQLIAFHAKKDSKYVFSGFFDDFHNPGTVLGLGIVLGGINDVYYFFEKGTFDCIIIGIGYKHFKIREKLYNDFNDIPLGTIIHSSTIKMEDTLIGKGVVIMPGCVFDKGVKIDDNVLLNTGCVLAHDSFIGKHSFLSPGVTIAGFVTIGECCNIGINTTIIDNITICDNVQTGGGAVVIDSVFEEGLYVGVPAKKIK